MTRPKKKILAAALVAGGGLGISIGIWAWIFPIVLLGMLLSVAFGVIVCIVANVLDEDGVKEACSPDGAVRGYQPDQTAADGIGDPPSVEDTLDSSEDLFQVIHCPRCGAVFVLWR